jgi:hypothetical protein
MEQDQPLNQWQHGVDEIVAKTAKLYARHTHLCALVLKQRTPDDALLVLAEADRCVKQILAQLDRMEGMCMNSPFFQSEQQTSESRT